MNRVVALLMLLVGCGEAVDSSSNARVADAPMLGAADGMDGADYGCQVVARQIRRTVEPPGFVTRCVDGTCSWAWRATVDVSDGALAEGASPGVLYQGMDEVWREVDGLPIRGVNAGMTRYGFDVFEGLVGPGSTSTTGLANYRLNLIPFLRFPDGRRVFDHNRLSDAGVSYGLGAETDYALLDDPRVCADGVDAVIRLGSDWGVEQLGELRGGSRVAVVYDSNRLSGCRATHNGNPAWMLDANVRFDEVDVATSSVIAFPDSWGTDADDLPVFFDVPSDATSLELWFKAASYAGSFCESYDSNFGKNYRFDVTPLAQPDWVGNATVTVSRAASHPCESGVDLSGGFDYGTWARSRAAVASVCTEIYAAGVTDGQVGDVFDAKVEVRYAGTQDWVAVPMVFDQQVGNNVRYRASIRAMDPFPMYGGVCADVPVEHDDQQMWTTAELRFVVNGQAMGDVYSGAFTQYVDLSCF